MKWAAYLTLFEILFALVFCILTISFILGLMFSPKLRGKFMSKRIKATKYMMDESKDDIHNISLNMADATKEGIEETTKAIKKGLNQQNKYCKYCGCVIDNDSIFCKNCGKKQ